MDADLNKMLLKKAGALLARRACSRAELRNKLAKIAQDIQVESVLDRLEKLNLLNDLDYAYNFALYRIKQEGWGPAKVRNSLLRRQVALQTVDAAMIRVRNDVDYEAALLDYVRKFYGKRDFPSDRKQVRKLIVHLHQRGFDDDTISSALKRVIPATLLQRFETGE